MKTCRRCTGFLNYEDDQWGGHNSCVQCGWEESVWVISDQRADRIMAYQEDNEMRTGFGLRHVGLHSSGVPTELRKRLEGGISTSDALIDIETSSSARNLN